MIAPTLHKHVANGRVTQTGYDPFGRLVSLTDPDAVAFTPDPIVANPRSAQSWKALDVHFEHSQDEKLEEWIRKNKDEELTVIGHSWGAATATCVVAEGNRVEKLVTVDPVSWRRPDYSKVAEHSGSWHNYDSVSTSWDLSNIVAWWGRRWNDAPEPFADLDHDEICKWHCVPP